MKCLICTTNTLSPKQFCNICESKISELAQQLKVSDKLLKFVLTNRQWIDELANKCETDWHGKLMLSAKGGKLILAGWYETTLLNSSDNY